MLNFYPILLSKMNTDTFLPQGEDTITDDGQIKSSTFSFTDDIADKLTFLGSSGFDWFLKSINILFIVGVIVMIMSMIFKNVQWQKYAQTTMLWSFISLMLLRGIPIIILSFKTKADVDAAFTAALSTISEVAIFTGLIGISISLLFKFGHTLIKHPEYYKWYKNSRNISIIMISFAFFGPIIFALL